jgi:LSM domain
VEAKRLSERSKALMIMCVVRSKGAGIHNACFFNKYALPLTIVIFPKNFVDITINQVNLVLDDAVEYSVDPRDKSKMIKTELKTEILLNGNQIAVLVPGGTGPPEDSLAAADHDM